MRGGWKRRFAICAFATCASRASLAAEPPADPNTAEVLFRDGKRLMEEGRYGEACPRLADSHKLDPGGGSVLALAMCYERNGQLASAWTSYNEALSFALRDGQKEREQKTRNRLSAIEPRLSKLSIEAPVDRPQGLEIKRDGALIPETAWGVPVPVDLGQHTVYAIAPGRQSWATSVDLDTMGATAVVRIPVLEPEPRAPAENAATPMAAPARPPAKTPAPRVLPERLHDRGATTRHIWAVATMTGGGVALVNGAVFGVAAVLASAEANRLCPDTSCSDPNGVSRSQEASTFATVANVSVGVGVAAVAVGVFLLLTGNDDATLRSSRRTNPLRLEFQ
jgi:serine/threonine-protein kinase